MITNMPKKPNVKPGVPDFKPAEKQTEKKPAAKKPAAKKTGKTC